MQEFNGVEDTLFIPLVGRIQGSKKYSELFYDKKALDLEKNIKSTLIQENTDEYFTLAAIARYYEIDNLLKRFFEKNSNENVNVVSIGCGLETMNYRVNSTNAIFYQIDMPKVIEDRNKVLGTAQNEVLIGSNVLDFSWIEMIDTTKKTLVIAAGVFQYLKEEEVLSLINELKLRFTKVEIAFDATNKSGIKKATAYVKKTGNTDVMMYFYVKNVKKFASVCKAKAFEVVPFYKNSSRLLKNKLQLSTKYTCFFADKLGFTKIIHLELN